MICSSLVCDVSKFESGRMVRAPSRRGLVPHPRSGQIACRPAFRQTTFHLAWCAWLGPMPVDSTPSSSEGIERIRGSCTASGTGTRPAPYRVVPRAPDRGASSCPCRAPQSAPKIRVPLDSLCERVERLTMCPARIQKRRVGRDAKRLLVQVKEIEKHGRPPHPGRWADYLTSSHRGHSGASKPVRTTASGNGDSVGWAASNFAGQRILL